MNHFSTIFLLALALSLTTELWLSRRQIRHVRAHRSELPAMFAGRVAPETHQRAADYTVAKMSLGIGESLLGALLLLGWTLGGGLDMLAEAWGGTSYPPLAQGVGLMLTFFVIVTLLDLPLAAYRTFGVEQRFGFNRSTPRLFIADLFKQALLLLLFGAPLAAVVLWLMAGAGTLWWLHVWLVWMVFSLLMLWAFPTFIAPLFNRFAPLDDSALEQRIRQLLQRSGFNFQGVFVMDGSRRSSHGNAYFTGLGSNKRIIFFDTLLKQLKAEEIEAVLAHELGHFRHRHVLKRMAVIGMMSLVALAILGWLIEQPWFYAGLGVETPSVAVALLLFLLVAPVFSFLVQPGLAYLMRKDEFEADNYAAEQTEATHLIQALVTLYQENASTLTPDPLYSAYHDSHPPALLRIARLMQRVDSNSDPKLNGGLV